MLEPSSQWVIWFICCRNSSSHLRPGEASDLANDMQVFLPLQKGSSSGMGMGKHLSPSNEVEDDDFEQHLLELVGVLVRSWSMNCPICITSTVGYRRPRSSPPSSSG